MGDTVTGTPRKIHFPPDLLRRHHLYVARTRMGKSTLMRHVVVHKMREKAAGRDGDAIVVVDPHADLVGGLLEHVPESLIDRVRLIDLADERGAPGVNLLDTRIFSDRDRTADSVVRVCRGLWDQWGPRMQSILEQTVKSLHEANESMDEEEQYTILDGLRILSDSDFRSRALAKVNDPYLLEWWARDFGGWRRETRADALAPVQTRLSYYASSKRARAILGQSRSTIDLRRTIHDGDILFVSTAQGTAGRDVAALVGASLLNLVDAVVREQGSVPIEQRRGALVVVDEMQSMPGVDYESMLSELGKFGASFILATQSLAKLDDLSHTMRDTILANVGCLAVFQVSGNDARQLVWELGKERVSEDDITSLPVHHCYVRATVGRERMAAFSMMVRKPKEGDSRTADRIRAEAGSYVTEASDMDERETGRQDLVERYRRELEKLGNGRGTQAPRATDPGSGRGASSAPGATGTPDPRHRRSPTSDVTNEAGGRGSCSGSWPVCRSSTGLEMVAVSGWSRGAVYKAIPRMEGAGLIASVPHGTEFTSPARRFHLTAAGPAPPGQLQRRGPGGPAPQSTRIGPVEASPPGAPRRRGRHISPRLDHIECGPSRPIPLVPRHAYGRRRHPSRRRDHRYRPAGTYDRPDGFRQAALAAEAGAAPRSGPHADAGRGAAAPRPQNTLPDLRSGALHTGTGDCNRCPGRTGVAAAIHQRRSQPEVGHR